MKKTKTFYSSILILVAACAFVGRQVIAGNDKFSYEDIIRLEKVVNKISEFYVEEIDSENLVKAAIEGLRTILDPHTAYFAEKDYNDLKVSTEGAFGGLGIQIAIRDNILTIISPLPGTPAYRMGLQAGDKIIEIDGATTENITIDNAVEKLRGKPGSSVTILILRVGTPEPLEFTIVRDIIKIKSVPFAAMLNDSTGLIQITQFSKRTTNDLEEKILALRKQGLTSLILDLRNNPGGLLNQAIGVSDFFLDKNQLVVYTKGRTRSQNKEYLSEQAPLWNKDHRLIILVNAGSASASEIVAGAVQDHDRGLIMGMPTFGKGSVQTILPLDAEKYALKLTTAYYYTPSGRCINKANNEPKHFDEDGEEKKSGSSNSDTTKEYFTDAGRVVNAGGGIKPDVEIESNLYTRYIRELERKTMFFKFIIKNRKRIEQKQNVSNQFEVDDQLRNDFKEYIYSDTSFLQYKSASHLVLTEFSKTLEKEREALGDTLPSKINTNIDSLKASIEKLLAEKTKMQFDQNKEYIDFALKRELLQAIAGDSARHVHELSVDIQVKEAIKYFQDGALYAEAISKKKQENKAESSSGKKPQKK